MCLGTAVQGLAGVGEDLARDLEGLLRVEAQQTLGGGDLVRAERGAVGGLGVPGVGRGPGDDGAHRDDRGPSGLGLRRLQRRVKRADVDVAVGRGLDALHVPAVGLVALQHVLGEGGGGVALDGDVVVVVDEDQIAQLLVAREEEASAEMPSSRSPSETMPQMVWSKGDSPSGVSGSNRPRS